MTNQATKQPTKTPTHQPTNRQTFAIVWSRYLWLGVTLNQQKNKHDAQKLFRQGEQQQARVNYIVADDYFSELPRMR